MTKIDKIDIENISPWVLRFELESLFMLHKQVTMFEIYQFIKNKYKDKKTKWNEFS